MPSKSLEKWQNERAKELDQIEQTHVAVSGGGRGRRSVAIQHINQAYLLLLFSHFQGFCRDLFHESSGHLANAITNPKLSAAVRSSFEFNCKLDRGNPTPGNIGSDFGRFGVKLWDEMCRLHPKNKGKREELEKMNLWRNAFAHQDFSNPDLKKAGKFNYAYVTYRRQHVCNPLAVDFVTVLYEHLKAMTGKKPW